MYSLLVVVCLQTPAVDRSGEAALRNVLTTLASAAKLHLNIDKFGREREGARFSSDNNLEIWKAGKKLRVELTSYWGDNRLMVADGATVLEDSMSDWAPVELRDQKPSWIESFPAFGFDGDQMTPLFYMLEGASALDKIAQKDKPIVDVGGRINFSSKLFGATTVVYHQNGKAAVLDEIMFDNQAWLHEQHAKYPEWTDAPVPGALSRHVVSYLPWREGRNWFVSSPVKGREVSDLRKAKKPPLVD